MIARAPGQIVLSGAYAALEGAPAIVAAVDRYVIADSRRSSDLVTEGVLAAMGVGVLDRVPWFDAEALFVKLPDGTSRTMGLGSSAATLVASLAAVLAEEIDDIDRLRRELLPIAITAHRQSKPPSGMISGGYGPVSVALPPTLRTGIDIVASVRGGINRCALRPDGALKVEPFQIPAGVALSLYLCPGAANKSQMIDDVRGLRRTNPSVYRSLMESAINGALSAAKAADGAGFIRALSLQTEALGTLGKLARAPIVIDAVRELRAIAVDEEATFGPTGVGGGDIALWAGPNPPSPGFRERALALGLTPLSLSVGAPGLAVSADPG